MADDNFLTRLLSSLTPEPFDRDLNEKAYQMAGGDSNPTAQQDTKAMVDKLRDERNKAPLPSDGDMVRNVLMKGVLPPSDVPNFSAGKDPMWFSPQGPIRPDQLPPSPLKPEIQEQMMAAAAKQNLLPSGMPQAPTPAPDITSKPMNMASSIPKSMPQVKAEVPAPAMPTSTIPSKEDDRAAMLKKLIESSTDDRELRNAMEEQKQREAIGMMLRGVAGIGAGLSGQAAAQVGDTYMKDFMESGKTGVANVRELMKAKQEKVKFALDTEKGMLDLDKTRIQMDDAKAMQDPNSDISKAWREAARTRFKLAGVKVPADMISEILPASKIKELFPSGDIVDDLIKLRGIEESAAMRKEARSDANRQRAQQQINNYVQHTQDKFKDDVNKVKEGRAAVAALESAIRSPSSVKDLQAIYNMIKAFDPNSAVREGELVMAQKGQSYVDNAKTLFSKIGSNPRLLTGRYLKDVHDYAKAAQAAREKSYRSTMDTRLNYAKDRLGLQEGQEIFIDPLYEETKKQKTQVPSAPFDADAAKAELERRKKVK